MGPGGGGRQGIGARGMAVLGVGLFLGSLAGGPVFLRVDTVSDALTATRDEAARIIVVEIRLPRAILSVLVGMMVILGMVISLLEGWRIGDGLYFAFVSGLTIGYGDLVPKAHLSRVLAIGIGFTGILLTGLVAAVGVNALTAALQETRKTPG